MALKHWRKIDSTFYENKFNKRNIYIRKLDKVYAPFTNGKLWIVQTGGQWINPKNEYGISIPLKTKKEAIKLAINYMKKTAK